MTMPATRVAQTTVGLVAVNERKRQALRRALHDEQPISARLKALDQAASMRFDRRDFTALERLVWDRSPELRQRAAMYMTRIASPEAVETHRRLLFHRDYVVRMNAVHGLGLAWPHKSEDEDRLLQVLLDADEHPRVRAEAAEALGAFRGARVVAALKRMTNDPSPVVRFFAIHGLWHLRAFDALTAIERRRNDRGRTEFGTVGSKAREVLRDLESRKRPLRGRAG